MEYIFEDCVSKKLESAIKVKIEADVLKKIEVFVSNIIKKKSDEPQHIIDNMKERKRFTTGLLGEAALEKVLGIPIIDWTIGDSKDYHVPDIPGYSVGIKTVEYGKFPIIFKKNFYPQVICIVDTKEEGTVYICGIAMTDILNEYQDISLVLDEKLRARGTKTGFHGFDYLQDISGLNDLEAYKKKICPECNRKMVLRNGKYGQFWGCTGFPNCRHTEKV